MRKFFTLLGIATLPLVMIACSDDDEEKVRLKVAELTEISHKAGECPKADGLYNRKDGLTTGVMAFNITNGGNTLQLANKATGVDGTNLIVDGKVHEKTENNQPLRYVAGCEGGKLTLRGSIGSEKIDLEFTDKGGGELVAKENGQDVVYEKTVKLPGDTKASGDEKPEGRF